MATQMPSLPSASAVPLLAVFGAFILLAAVIIVGQRLRFNSATYGGLAGVVVFLVALAAWSQPPWVIILVGLLGLFAIGAQVRLSYSESSDAADRHLDLQRRNESIERRLDGLDRLAVATRLRVRERLWEHVNGIEALLSDLRSADVQADFAEDSHPVGDPYLYALKKTQRDLEVDIQFKRLYETPLLAIADTLKNYGLAFDRDCIELLRTKDIRTPADIRSIKEHLAMIAEQLRA